MNITNTITEGNRDNTFSDTILFYTIILYVHLFSWVVKYIDKNIS